MLIPIRCFTCGKVRARSRKGHQSDAFAARTAVVSAQLLTVCMCLPSPAPYVALQVIANKYQSYISMMIDEEKPRTAG
jgi:DNA-directed RNA polymerase subunit N (RpoN/RPB10)